MFDLPDGSWHIVNHQQSTGNVCGSENKGEEGELLRGAGLVGWLWLCVCGGGDTMCKVSCSRGWLWWLWWWCVSVCGGGSGGGVVVVVVVYVCVVVVVVYVW